MLLKCLEHSSLIKSDKTNGHNDEYLRALNLQKAVAGAQGIDAALKAHSLDALVLPARGMASTPPGKDAKVIVLPPQSLLLINSCVLGLLALCGYPIVTGTVNLSDFRL